MVLCCNTDSEEGLYLQPLGSALERPVEELLVSNQKKEEEDLRTEVMEYLEECMTKLKVVEAPQEEVSVRIIDWVWE